MGAQNHLRRLSLSGKITLCSRQKFISQDSFLSLRFQDPQSYDSSFGKLKDSSVSNLSPTGFALIAICERRLDLLIVGPKRIFFPEHISALGA
jgi:hypothetical protein